MNNMEPPFPADPDPIPEAYLRGPSFRDELLYLARLNVAILSVGGNLSSTRAVSLSLMRESGRRIVNGL